MAVFRITSFTKVAHLAKKSIRYITHRRGRDGKTVTRQLFGREGGTDKTEAYEKIDKARRGTTFFRIIISPDPALEDTLKDLARISHTPFKSCAAACNWRVGSC